MKPIYEKIPSREEHSFHTHKAVHPYLYTPWHYHPESEILYVKKSTGTRYVGNSIERFKPGEVVLVGPNMPHVWQNDKKYYESINGLTAEVLVCHFNEHVFGHTFIDMPEMKALNKLFQLSRKAVRVEFKDKQLKTFEKVFDRLINSDGVKRIQLFLELTGMLMNSEHFLLNETPFSGEHPAESEKMQKVYEYVTMNFKEHILLEEAASKFYMSVTGFGRYFKQMNGKTFINYVNEVRIAHACQLIREDNLSITQICFESGFNNYANFSRQFIKVKKVTPKMYRNKFKGMF
ncbi:MAG: AraC family transcriptional regulator [Prolixibacteraceae bacterium]|nr:AraC family transcriptional regulator [Prolixibacteraceae bacterium]